MTETNLGVIGVIALAICVIDCLLWMLGGRSGKWKRRFVGAAVQTAGINILAFITGTWVWQFAVSLVPEIASRSMGYGGDTTGQKVLRRAVFAAGSLAVGVILAWGVGFSAKVVWLLIAQAVAAIVSVILGVKSIIPAAVEEVFVCLSLKYLNYCYLFIGAVTK